jgi:hypothetical protein
MGQGFGGVKQRFQRVDAQHAGAPHGGVEDRVRSGQGAGM